MRVYHFLSAENALDDLRRRQIMLSKVDALNDPFELWCFAQEDQRIAAALRELKDEAARDYGMLCFSRHWHNPVMWSHYSDRHKGICLGIEVDEQFLRPISYVKERPPLQYPPTQETMMQLLFTKYRDWCYEEELRCWFRLEERDSEGLYFYSFNNEVQLREVIAGPLCSEPRVVIDEALKGYESVPRVIKAHLAFTTFQVVEDAQGFRR
jgi:hypothetical protein